MTLVVVLFDVVRPPLPGDLRGRGLHVAVIIIVFFFLFLFFGVGLHAAAVAVVHAVEEVGAGVGLDFGIRGKGGEREGRIN